MSRKTFLFWVDKIAKRLKLSALKEDKPITMIEIKAFMEE